jgi:GH24 family phage-related lysozyme (muramidase)
MAGQARAAPHDLNADQTISASGVAAIRDGEGLRNGGAHYNDIANNCTVGLGTLVHHGPCTAAELAQPADQQANDASLARRIADAEATVRRRVGDRQLTRRSTMRSFPPHIIWVRGTSGLFWIKQIRATTLASCKLCAPASCFNP